MNKKKFEQDGTPVSSRRLYEERLVQVAELMMRFEDLWYRYDSEDTTILDIRIKCPPGGVGGYLVVVRATAGGRRLVSFTSGDSLMEAMRTVLARLENYSITWKDDQYAGQ